MRRCAVTWGCLLLLAPALLALHAGCRSTSVSSGSLTGTVRDAATNGPIENAEVAVGAATTLTDAGGRFTLDELELGDRPFTITATGYQILKKTVTIEAGENTVVFELLPHARTDGGLADGAAHDGPQQQDAGQRDAAQHDAASCVGTACTYGYTYYGGCCASAPYCANYYGASSLVCRTTCGAVNERCATGYDCCNSNCVSGYCAAPSCSGNTCTGGYYDYSGCCADAPYCANYNGASYLVCRSTCGAANERCYSNGDCCSNSCVSGYCAAASCAGNTCTGGYWNGGCCASQPYCLAYYSVATTTCQATQGSATQHCSTNYDCISNSCTYKNPPGWNTCN
jgi:hypothetical protein